MTSASAGSGFCPQWVAVDNYLCGTKDSLFSCTISHNVQLKERKLLLLFIHTLGAHYSGFVFRMRCSCVIP